MDRFRTCPDCARLLLGSSAHDCAEGPLAYAVPDAEGRE